jgi:hypothetical protein
MTSSDRRSLLQILTVYTDALCLKDVSAVPVAPRVRVTDNGDVTTLGEGTVWQTPGKIRIPFRHALVDPGTGAVMFRGTVTNESASLEELANPPPGEWLWYALRLKVVDGFITEIEEIVSKVGFPGCPASSLTIPDRIWDIMVPEEQRSTADELKHIADDYFSTISGTIPWNKAPVHPECNRYELGFPTTNAAFLPGSVTTSLLNPLLKGLTVTNRRFYVVDTILGVVGAIAKFTPPERGPGEGGAIAAVVFEEFKIQDGLIRHVEAFLNLEVQDYSGWGTGPGSSSSDP